MKRSIYLATIVALSLFISKVSFAGITVTSGTTFSVLSATTVTTDGVDINSSGTVANSGTIDDTGDWANSGTAGVGGTVKFTGAAAKSISGTTSFNGTLEIDGAGATTISGGDTRVMGTLILTSGTLNSNGFLTIGSDATGTGRIDGSGSGSTSGNITVERFVATTNAGWRYFHTPVNGATGAEFSDDVTLSATSFGGTVNSSPFPDLFYYDETNASANNNDGYTTLSSAGDALGQGQGFTLQMPGSGTVDITGTYNHGAGSRVFTGTHSNNGVSSDGWNLQGNPHPSAIDWDALSRSNMDDAVYSWKSTSAYGGSYASYVNSIGANGGTNELPSMQAFFVHVTSAGNGTLTSDNTDRITTDPTFLKKEVDDLLRLTASGNGIADETVVYFESMASEGFDPSFDAYKLMGTDMNLYTVAGNDNISINALPAVTEDVIIPLNFSAGTAGEYAISVDGISSFDPGTVIYIEDLQTNTIQDLTLNEVYSFNGDPVDAAARFQLRFSAKTTGIQDPLPAVNIYSNYDRAILEFEDFDGSQVATVEVFNALGQSVIEPEVIDAGIHRHEISLNNLATGNYIIKVRVDHELFNEKVFVNAQK